MESGEKDLGNKRLAEEKPVFVEKTGTCVEACRPLNPGAQQCKRCFKVCLAVGGNTSNLFKHLKDNHADLFRDSSQERQVSIEK